MAASGYFLRVKPKGNPEDQPCQPEETLSFLTLLLIFPIGFRIGLAKMHRRFRIGPPKIHRQFRIGSPLVTLNLLPPEFHSQGILVYHAYYARNATKLSN